MTNIKALDKLIAAVEKDMAGPVPHHFDDVFGVSPLGNNAIGAYHGSLDAAKALHDALLPEWLLWALEEEDAAYCGWTAMIFKRKNRDVGVCVSNQPNPARAWLIAILKAYRTQMEAS